MFGNSCGLFRYLDKNRNGLGKGPYFAFLLSSIMPKVFPSVSWHVANQPTPGIAILGIRILPPLASIFLQTLSTDFTSIVFMFGIPLSPFFERPPLMPLSFFEPVFTIQYSIGPSHFLNSQPKMSS